MFMKTAILVIFGVIIACLETSALYFFGSSNTFARFPNWNACSKASISFEFKTRQPSALLLYTEKNSRYKRLQLALTQGAVRLWIHLESNENQFVDIEANTDMLNDGRWHRVEIRRRLLQTTLLVDGTQTSKVGLGSDDIYEDDLNRSNYVFFGGLPKGYNNSSIDVGSSKDFRKRFRGDIRNIMYFNCSCIPVRALVQEFAGVSNDRPEACEIENRCPDDCPCVSVDDGTGCECTFKKQCLKDTVADYYLPMDVLDGIALVNPSGLDSVVEGHPDLVEGVFGQALQLQVGRQWLRVTGGSHRSGCMGNLSRCEQGYFIGLWMKLEETGHERQVYLSNGGHDRNNHGVAIIYSNGILEVVFKMTDGRTWQTQTRDIFEQRWYHVAATWSKDSGLYLYIDGKLRSHDKFATMKEADRLRSTYSGFYIGRANDNSRTNNIGHIVVDEFRFVSQLKDKKAIRKSGAIYHYHVSMDAIVNNSLTGKGLTGNVIGPVSEVNGKIGGAVLLFGSKEYIDFGDMSDTCLGDIDLCQHGFYLSLWVMVNGQYSEHGQEVVISSPTFDLRHDRSGLSATVHNHRQTWSTSYNSFDVGKWYFVEMSWNLTDGLLLYVNSHQVDYQQSAASWPPETGVSTNLYVGLNGDGNTAVQLAVTVDELNFYNADINTLKKIHFIQSERPNHIHFSMDTITRGRLPHDTIVAHARGNPEIVDGKVGSAILLNGQQDGIDFGDHSANCFGNLDLCSFGYMTSMWLQIQAPHQDTHLLSTGVNGIQVMILPARKLQVKAMTSTSVIAIDSVEFTPNMWHFLEISYHPERGLVVYVDKKLSAKSTLHIVRIGKELTDEYTGRFYIGMMSKERLTSIGSATQTYDEVEVWNADRDFLIAHDFIERGPPEQVVVKFEELLDSSHVLHTTLDIRLIGRPNLVPGKVGNALQLRGHGQYADLGQLGHTCMGNLALCKHGVTLSAWMRFRSFENQMVFLSTGDNGFLLLYKDGYLQASINGHGIVTAPRCDTLRWYQIEISFHPDIGLKLYVNNKLIGESASSALRRRFSLRDVGRFYIGRPNAEDAIGVRYTNGNFDIDELEVWNRKRDDLLAFDYISRNERKHITITMDAAHGNRLSHEHLYLLLKHGARIGPGYVHQALYLDGQGQYLDIGSHLNSCLGNMDLCTHGFTLSIWLKPEQLVDDAYFISAPSYSLFYKNRRLSAVFNAEGQSWQTDSSNFLSGDWQRVTLSWHIKHGLSMYVNDNLVGRSQGVKRQRRESPLSRHVYIGRALGEDLKTAAVQVDQLNVWYEYINQLMATGHYQAEVTPFRLTFDNYRNGFIAVRDRQIRAWGSVISVSGLADSSKAIYLDGQTQYLDMGENFTCNGDLHLCQQGVTFRIAINQEKLQDGSYFLDSFPMKLFYKNGRLVGHMRTATQLWSVYTPDFQAGRWTRVELSWHPSHGLRMYLDGRLVDYESFPRITTAPLYIDRRTFVGRPLQERDGRFATVRIDNVELYNAYRDAVAYDAYLPLVRSQSTNVNLPDVDRWTQKTPMSTGGGSIVKNEIDSNTQRRTTKIIRLNGHSYVMFDFNRLPREYLRPTAEEVFSFWFLTEQPDGLIWRHQDSKRDMYIAMKDGFLQFVHDNRNDARSRDVIVIGQNNGRRLNDYQWYMLKIRKNGRHVYFNVDDTEKEHIFSDDVQFLTQGNVWLGGSPDTLASTKGYIGKNFQGGIAEVIYVSIHHQGQRIFRNEVNLITQINEGSTIGEVDVISIPFDPNSGGSFVTFPVRPATTTTSTTPLPYPPMTLTTSVSIVRTGVVLTAGQLNIKYGTSISFRFQTIIQNGVLFFAGNSRGKYIGLELIDGKLYFVRHFGQLEARSQFTDQELSDGQLHEVEIRFYNLSHVDLRVDGARQRVQWVNGETLPTNLGLLYIGSYVDYSALPWMMFARHAFIGCISDLKVDSSMVDFERFVQHFYGRVVSGCRDMPRDCSLLQPCAHGRCQNTMTNFRCDCTSTAYRGVHCSQDAWAVVFNGSVTLHGDLSDMSSSHSNVISLRFRTLLNDSLMFETESQTSNDFLRGSLDGGRVKVETNLGGQIKTMYAGENLNDFGWHTMVIRRHGNDMSLLVDNNLPATVKLAGKNYFLDISRIYLAGKSNYKNRYIGYLQNFILNDIDILERLKGQGVEVNTYPHLPPLLFSPFTIPDLDTHLLIHALPYTQSLALHLMFKTEESSGVLILSNGHNNGFLVVELFEGRIYIHLHTGVGQPLRATSQQQVNDGQWHSITLHKVTDPQRQFLLTVDDVTSAVSYSGQDETTFLKELYIGGASKRLLTQDSIRSAIFSRTGFRGCLASVDINGQVPDIAKYAQQQKVTVYEGCHKITPQIACTSDSCYNFGQCYEGGGDSFTCDCQLSAHAGRYCQLEPVGYRFQNFSRPGILVYTVPQQRATFQDAIAFGVMTTQSDNAILLRAFSESIGDFIEIRLEDGYMVVHYDTDARGGQQTIAQRLIRVNDGKYYVVRFNRSSTSALLYVHTLPAVINTHSGSHGSFDRLSKIYVGGGYTENDQIVEGFDGIIGGLSINGKVMFIDDFADENKLLIGDVVMAPRPFNLTTRGPSIIVIPTPSVPIDPIVPGETTGNTGVIIPPAIPPDIGGGGIAWVPGPSGVDTILYPGENSGTAVLVPGSGHVAPSAGGPVVSALVAHPPPLLGSGPRAGAIVGTLLGVMVLSSGMMWALYRCKPGWCACIKLPAAAAHALSISSPSPLILTSSTNKGAVLAAGGGIGGTGAAGAIVGNDATGATAGASASGAAGSTTDYFVSQSTIAGGNVGVGGTAGSGGAFRSDIQSSSSVNQRRMDTVDGAALHMPTIVQANRYEGGGGLGNSGDDYDMATDSEHGYHSGTIQSVGGSRFGGSLAGGGFSTLHSSYNYSVNTVRLVSGQQQKMVALAGSDVGIPPGALGEEVRVDCCLMARDGKNVITGSSSGPPQVWDMQRGELVQVMQGQTSGSTKLHLACDDHLLVGAVNAELEANQFSVPKGVNHYSLQIWDLTTGRSLDMTSAPVFSALAMMKDADRVVFACSDKLANCTHFVVWDLIANQSVKEMHYDTPVGNNDYVGYLALSQNDRYVVAGFTNSLDSYAEFVLLDTAQPSGMVSDPSVLRLDANVDCTATLPREEAVTGLRNGDMVIWSMATGQPSRQLMSRSGNHAHSSEVKAVARSEDNRYLVSVSVDKTIKIWDMESERHVSTLFGHTDEVWCCAISPDNEIVVSGSRDCTIRLWRLKSGSEICRYDAGVDIFHVTMSRDKSTVVGLGDMLGARKLVMLQVVRTKVRHNTSR